MFDRSDDKWDAIVGDTQAILEDQARLRRITSYTDVNTALARRGHRPFDFLHTKQSQRCWACARRCGAPDHRRYRSNAVSNRCLHRSKRCRPRVLQLGHTTRSASKHCIG